jgi:succinate-acetate transporter protein
LLKPTLRALFKVIIVKSVYLFFWGMSPKSKSDIAFFFTLFEIGIHMFAKPSQPALFGFAFTTILLSICNASIYKLKMNAALIGYRPRWSAQIVVGILMFLKGSTFGHVVFFSSGAFRWSVAFFVAIPGIAPEGFVAPTGSFMGGFFHLWAIRRHLLLYLLVLLQLLHFQAEAAELRGVFDLSCALAHLRAAVSLELEWRCRNTQGRRVDGSDLWVPGVLPGPGGAGQRDRGERAAADRGPEERRKGTGVPTQMGEPTAWP